MKCIREEQSDLRIVLFSDVAAVSNVKLCSSLGSRRDEVRGLRIYGPEEESDPEAKIFVSVHVHL